MNKKIYILSIVPLIFPILSREDIIPWLVALFFINKSIQAIKSNINVNRKLVVNITSSGALILAFNLLASAIQNYFSKLLL